jgi:hypothetical protein
VEEWVKGLGLGREDYGTHSLRRTKTASPAMAAGVTDRLWEVREIVNGLEAWEATN